MNNLDCEFVSLEYSWKLLELLTYFFFYVTWKEKALYLPSYIWKSRVPPTGHDWKYSPLSLVIDWNNHNFLSHQLHQIYHDRCLRVYPTVAYTSWTTSYCCSVLYRCHLGGVTLKHSKHDLYDARVKKLKEHLLQTFVTSRTAHHGTWNSNLTYVKHIVCRWISPILNIIVVKCSCRLFQDILKADILNEYWWIHRVDRDHLAIPWRKWNLITLMELTY